MILDRSAILQNRTLPRVEVDVPELGGSVFVRVMTAGDRDRLEAQIRRLNSEDEAEHHLRSRLAIFTVCDEQGNRLFTEADLPDLLEMAHPAMDRIWTVASELNLVTKQDVDDLKKTLKNGRNGDSSSVSPLPSAEPSANSS